MGKGQLIVGAVLVGLLGCTTPVEDEEEEIPAAHSKKARADAGGAPADDTPNDAPPKANAPLAADLTLDEVAVYQALKIDLVAKGQAANPSLPIIAGREALVRAFVKPTSAYQPRSITARLTLTTNGKTKTFEDHRVPTGASTDAAFDSSFWFKLAPEDLDAGTTWKLELLDLAPKARLGDSSARWPRNGEDVLLGATEAGNLLVRIVPIKLSNGLMSDLSAVTQRAYRDYIRKMYPIRDIDIAITPVLGYSGAIPKGNGDGWSALLDAVRAKHKADHAPKNAYYIGVFRPAVTFSEYCSPVLNPGGCTSGLGNLLADDVVQQVPEYKSSVMAGFTADEAKVIEVTLPHELGHNHGREHAPCERKASNVDPNFPDQSGAIGTWGYDSTKDAFFNPQATTKPPRDIMSYCAPAWVSAYTYKHLYDRVALLKSWMPTASLNEPSRYREMHVRQDGTVDLGEVVVRPRLRMLDEDVEVESDAGALHVEKGLFIPYDHLAGGTLLVPEAVETPFVRARLRRSVGPGHDADLEH